MKPIGMSSPDLTGAELALVVEVLRSGELSIGPRISEFERRFAQYVGAPHGIAVSSGTAALHLATIAAGVEEGDLVITSPFSFVASANCVLYERGVPVFVDVDAETGNIDPALAADAAAALTGTSRSRARVASLPVSSRRYGRLKALLPIHAFGQPADMDPLVEVARVNGLALIEDACEAIGATYKGRTVGTFGDAAAFAFYPNKQMTTGEGGMLVTGSDTWDRLFRSLRNQGRDVFDAWLAHSRLGYNYRLDELSAALGVAQIARIEELLANRERVAGWYNDRLVDVERVQIPSIAGTTTRMSWFVYVVRLDPGVDRPGLMASLLESGIPTRPYFTPIHLQPFYVERFGYRRGDFPVAERLGDTCLALPFSGRMTEAQVEHVCQQLARAIHGQGARERIAVPNDTVEIR